MYMFRFRLWIWQVISDILGDGGVAVLCGGSAMYLTWLLDGRETETTTAEEGGGGGGGEAAAAAPKRESEQCLDSEPSREPRPASARCSRTEAKQTAADIVQAARDRAGADAVVFDESKWTDMIHGLAAEHGLDLDEEHVMKQKKKQQQQEEEERASSSVVVSVNDWFRLRGLIERAIHRKRTRESDGPDAGPSLDSQSHIIPPPELWRVFVCCPRDRVELYRIIDRRCEEMLTSSLVEETYELEKMTAIASRKGEGVMCV